MVRLKSLPNHPEKGLQKVGWDWMLGADTAPYVVSDVVVLKKRKLFNIMKPPEHYMK